MNLVNLNKSADSEETDASVYAVNSGDPGVYGVYGVTTCESNDYCESADFLQICWF